MSTSKSYQCLSCRMKTLRIDASYNGARRQFTTSISRRNRKPAFPSIKASDLGLVETASKQTASTKRFRPYTANEKELLAKKYTPEQMRVIEVGEQAIDDHDIEQQGRQRTDPMRISYYDDFAKSRPIIDFPVEDLLEDEETDVATALMMSSKKSGRSQGNTRDRTEKATVEPHLLRLSQQTGLDPQDIAKLRVKNLVTHRVVNQTRMGKIQSLYFLTIAGNMNGMVGIGEGKAAEDEDGRRQAMMSAIRNMKPIPRYENRTIYGDAEAKVGASIVQLSSRPPGFGNRCQHLIFELARAAGIQDLAARTPRSRNKMNVVKAAWEALVNQRLPEDIAKARGRKMVDVRKVYYGGSVL